MYFLLGGSITSVVAYLANNSKGFLAAFINTLPITSLSTFVIIYVSTGQDAVLSYARGLVIMLLPWILYVLSVIILTPRISFPYSLLVGLFLFILMSLLLITRYNLTGS
ncbi:MAG TPA: hypothetical protein VF790_07015 [Dissulfurispiraceae bacterium]